MNTSSIDARHLGGPGPHDSSPDVREVLRLLSDHLWTVIAIAAGTVVLAAAVVFLMKPTYSANVLVRVEAQDPNAFGIAQQGEIVVGQKPLATDAEIAMMQSRRVLEPVMRQFGYEVSVTPRKVPVLGTIAEKLASPGKPSRPWFGLDAFAWGGERIHIESVHVPYTLENNRLRLRVLENGRYVLLDPDGNALLTGSAGAPAADGPVSMLVTQLDARPGTEFYVTPLNEVNAIKRFSKDLKVVEKGKETGVVQITFESSDAATAANVANAIAQGYVAATVTQRRSNDSKTLDFINQELPRLRDELKQAEARLTDYRAKAGSLQPTAESQSYLQGGIDFQRQIATLQLQRTQLLQHFQPGSPPVQNIDQQLAQLNAQKAQFDARFNSMPESERTSADLTRSAKVAESIYVAMVNKAEELTVRRGATTGDVHIVDGAVRPADPVSPDVPLVLGASGGVGLMLGSLYVFTRRRLFTGVTDPRFVERSMSVPVFGSILYSAQQARLDRSASAAGAGAVVAEPAMPLLGPGREGRADPVAWPPAAQRLLARSFPQDPSVEALRGVRTALHLNVQETSDNMIVVTGPTPGTGKSFLAANLAVLEAETARRVLLVDADMRCGRIASLFDQPNADGLSELLAGRLKINQAIRQTGVPGLSLLSCGRYPGNPSELLMMPHFRSLLEEFKQRFDLVIVDTPPLLAVSDAAIVSHRAGKTVLVLRSGTQTEAEIEETVTKLERAGAWVVGAVFNAVPLRRSERRSYSYMSVYSNHNHVAA
ncbi:polysaccharide biosynthesis tyrosine autokinase [Paraburkholderia kururiensis]|uniref:Polysaccharide biosynthesis tyrosine autokinase n=1 Tax=Paraburkholderia kururiensis TaxID=984307 RepID=A0ABZ0WMW5_9BURK|nr:polysaccharide biosynthesis tyrosine autokinase [Paraburkholderia kururiensis]WQD78633.1 polysaccharide biosynthesis tyrosine autokinase [Paraburkholderia kururiensis]